MYFWIMIIISIIFNWVGTRCVAYLTFENKGFRGKISILNNIHLFLMKWKICYDYHECMGVEYSLIRQIG